MDLAVIGKAPRGIEGPRKCERDTVYVRVKYTVWTPWSPGCHAVIIADPIPLNRVAGSNSNGARTVNGAALAYRNILCRGESDLWKEKSEY